MGERLPKSVQKQATQKQAKVPGVEQEKKDAAAAKQTPAKKK